MTLPADKSKNAEKQKSKDNTEVQQLFFNMHLLCTIVFHDCLELFQLLCITADHYTETISLKAGIFFGGPWYREAK
jgi:hypothetical protein